MPHEFQLTRRVEFCDTDMAGLMHFSNFFRFMEAAESAFLRSLGYSVALSRNGLDLCLPRVHAHCDYLAPLRFEDEVLVHLLVERKGTRSLTYQFRFYRLEGPARFEVARGRLTVVCAAPHADGTLKAARLPAALAELLEPAPPELLALHQPGSSRPGNHPPQEGSDPAAAPGHGTRPNRAHSHYHSILQSRSSYE